MASGSSLGFEVSRSGHTEASRNTLKSELRGNIVFDDSSVFQHLGVDAIEDAFVKRAVELFEATPALVQARAELQVLTQGPQSREQEMYPRLALIFRFLELLKDGVGRQSRLRFFQSSGLQLVIEPNDSWMYPKNKPDFSAVLAELFDQPSNLWRDRFSWCEIKGLSGDRPHQVDPMADPKPITCQTADYARLHLSGYPFQLFSVGLLIYGDEFSVGIYDRVGVRYSHSYNMWGDFDIFVRVVRCITANMTPQQLGQDPTVRCLAPQERGAWLDKLQLNGLSTDDYALNDPVYEISLGGATSHLDSEHWITAGRPIWISLSMFGRGTLVWRVRNKQTLLLRVLKNAWRNGARSPESTVYEQIQGWHPGVARFDRGGDVKFPGQDAVISTATLRNGGIPIQESDQHAVLHRVLIYPVGRSLYSARSELELLKGLRAALQGHKFLCDQGILHRDISIGNIMLSSDEDPQPGAEGFLMDLEFARHTGPDVQRRTIPLVRTPNGQMLKDVKIMHIDFGQPSSIKRGAPMTGTLQFMAVDLLEALARRRTSQVEHLPQHDVESFIWVLIYALMRRLIEHPPDNIPEGFKNEFVMCFGRTTPMNIMTFRSSRTQWGFVREYPKVFSRPVRDLLRQLQKRFTRSSILQLDEDAPEEEEEGEGDVPEPLTHTAVLAALDTAIAKLPAH
ncbi:hypothetical protein OBBRIDRAFT_795539 [Obba rivulosa]|uniref:Protein kinase domain-containing protein n=1 Tax=Obba rivulosa TaxID=1052685 RepID=A0A8E2DJR8_9APHY|nr:hypothetical protein OBBRIDRAFT_795539 [Obba rivulosa]